MRLVFNSKNRNIFDALKNGTKKVETRASSPKYKNIKNGDVLIFICGKDTFQKTVSKVKHFRSIDKLLEIYKPKDINPNLKTKKETIELYHSFPNYESKIKEFGLVAFELE